MDPPRTLKRRKFTGKFKKIKKSVKTDFIVNGEFCFKFAKRVFRIGWKFSGVFLTKSYEVLKIFSPENSKWLPL